MIASWIIYAIVLGTNLGFKINYKADVLRTVMGAKGMPPVLCEIYDTSFYISMGTVVMTPISYVVVVIAIFKQYQGEGIKQALIKQRQILIYAFVRFIFNLFDITITEYGRDLVPETHIAEYLILLFYVFDNLVLPPMLYLMVNR
ncbi:hypothetical protein L596_019381 [Steinernema carpocapsae]|uniref:Uncharacterized protein n=1 Tax=Steinernema carpocapsae TaxID=34508 RepID=A0A4U5MQJ2_STECR|nr:hypothetical protein L596_019381 [Steinernema carpocapsae]